MYIYTEANSVTELNKEKYTEKTIQQTEREKMHSRTMHNGGFDEKQ